VTYAHREHQKITEKKITAKFLVGADGKTGFVRKKYLEPKGVIMEKSDRYELTQANDYLMAFNIKLQTNKRLDFNTKLNGSR